MLFTRKNKHFEHIKRKWTERHKSLQENFLEKHKEVGRQITLSTLGGLLLLTTPATHLLPQGFSLAQGQIAKEKDTNAEIAEKLKGIVPEEVRSLNSQEEDEVSNMLTSQFGFSVKPSINGIRLNRSYGVIGGEQHLYRYPGDTLYKHADNATDWAMYGSSGIAPGLGAWGYFAPSEREFSEIDKQREKYYLAVQTYLTPGFAENVKQYRDFFKFRKMLICNPKTGQAVIAVIGDAGPAEWTGKHLGGSPEVMHYLGLAGGPRKGAVLYFFIDDPDDKIPLGPIKVPERLARR